jgi:tetratricopeptide (TPR) repeat protein
MGGRDSETTQTMDAGARSKSPSQDLAHGAWVGRYVVLKELGRGGMGTVYAAYDSELDRRVALKFLRDRIGGGVAHERHARLMREAKAMARLSHPNVVTLYDVGLSGDGRIFLAMEAVEGGTLGDWLKAESRGWREIVSLFCEAGEGLAAAHRAGIIHRDFKLTNVLFGKDGRPRVTDFGLARSAEEQASEEPTTSRPSAPARSPETIASGPFAELSPRPSASSLATLTETGTWMGTPGFMAPEQYTTVTIDARADVFAFCATLYQALYGERAFEGESVEELAASTLMGAIREAPRRTLVPGWVRKVLCWGLATDRDARPASMPALLAALRADPAKLRRRWLAVGGVVAAACAVALSVRAAGERQVRSCRAMADRLGGVWDAPRKEGIREAFHRAGVSYADDTWERVAKRLDAYAASWTSATETACEATRVKGEQSEAMLDLRASCLDERLDELRALSDVFASADADTVRKAAQAASGLTPLAPCDNLDRLSAATRLPSEPGARAEIRALKAAIAEARELRAAGKQTQSWARLQELHERVDAARYGPVVLAWTMVAALVEEVRDLKASEQDWERAIELADTYHLDHERAASEVNLASTLKDLRRNDNAELSLRRASATLARIGGDPELELQRDQILGSIYANQARYADAVRVLKQAILRASADHAGNAIFIAGAHSKLALALLQDEAGLAEAVIHARAAVTIDEEAFGPEHPAVGNVVGDLAIVEAEVGRLDDALSAASRCLAIYRAGVARGEVSTRNVSLGLASQNEGEVLVRLGRAREAVDLIEDARGIYRAGDERERLTMADATLAEALLQVGRLDEAARVYDEGRTLEGQAKETDPECLLKLLVVGAKIAIGRGRPGEALPLAERALALVPGAGMTYLYDLSSARLVLARALIEKKSDLPRARTLGEQARDGFARLHDQPRIDEASALMGPAAQARQEGEASGR